MNCANHPEVNATAFCRDCGKAMCGECQRPALGSIYCADHVPVTPPVYAAPAYAPPPLPSQAYAPPPPPPSAWAESASFASSPYAAPVVAPVPGTTIHPVLALILGFCPGVGAICNGQYAKGLIHAVIFGLLISLVSNTHNSGMEGFLGIMIGVWVIYQAFEAYHTARKRRYGIAVEEFSSLFEVKHSHGKFPMSAVFLIVVGFVLLLDTTEIINMEQLERYWPLGLIGLGLYMLYVRLNPADAVNTHASDGGRQ